MPQKVIELAIKALKKFGVEAQMRMVQEEAAELIAAISHSLRGRGKEEELLEEFVDMDIVFTQMAIIISKIYEAEKIDAMYEAKLSRLKTLLGSGSRRPEK